MWYDSIKYTFVNLFFAYYYCLVTTYIVISEL